MLTVLVILIISGVASAAYGNHSVETTLIALKPWKKSENNNCIFTLCETSKLYFESLLIAIHPRFVHFNLRFNVTPNATAPRAFLPDRWVWTFKSPSINNPYLSWNIDHGILSFGLLDTKTSYVPYMTINVSDTCSVNLGESETTVQIVETFKEMFVEMLIQSRYKYEQIFFCYHEIVSRAKDPFWYSAALYLTFPVSFLRYRCCKLIYMYGTGQYKRYCPPELHEKWKQCSLGPFVLGIILCIYSPIMVFQFAAWLAKDEVIQTEERKTYYESEILDNCINNKWIYLDGTQPLTLFGACTLFFNKIARKWPVLTSRCRRLICVLIAPIGIFVELKMYENGIGVGNKITVKELVKSGVPLGFLSILGESEDRSKVFVPVLGGPVSLLIIHYVLAIIFLVFPRSLNEIVDRGIPRGNKVSPLLLGTKEIISLSLLSGSPKPGYESAFFVCKGSLYMLLNAKFWQKVFEIQRERMLLRWRHSSVAVKVIAWPLYTLFCVVENIVCVIYFAVPLCGLVSIMVTGAVKSLLHLRKRNRYFSAFFGNPVTVSMGAISVLILFILYFYSVCLIFVESSSFISGIIIFCFISLIVFPTISFGYLFFFVVLLFYLVRLIKDFGEGYLELLANAVETTRKLYGPMANVVVSYGQILSCDVTTFRLKSVRINDKLLDIPANVLQRIGQINKLEKIREQGNVFGIPKQLFKFLVQKHRPIQIQILKVLFRLTFIVLLITMTLSITSKIATGITSEISEVMHVVFIVAVGALPRILEVALLRSGESVRRERELADIEQTIKEYWDLEEGGLLLSVTRL